MQNKSGVVAIRNLKTDKVFLFWADDILAENTKQRFSLDLGCHGCQSLQEDYTNTGLEVFRFETVEETDDPSRLAYYEKTFTNRYPV